MYEMKISESCMFFLKKPNFFINCFEYGNKTSQTKHGPELILSSLGLVLDLGLVRREGQNPGEVEPNRFLVSTYQVRWALGDTTDHTNILKLEYLRGDPARPAGLGGSQTRWHHSLCPPPPVQSHQRSQRTWELPVWFPWGISSLQSPIAVDDR